ncbi:MAG: cohesin domain-containing protein [Candidatus Methylacidiphilales bacterium]|nr:cohesin domain-containing protein [Candidatus Methylacidiphilales bacterium]
MSKRSITMHSGNWIAVCLLVVILSRPTDSVARTVSLPDYLANPGSRVKVPVYLDDATGIASIKIKINYDSSALVFNEVECTQLGLQFELSQADDDGVISLILFRHSNLTSGSGMLLLLDFQVNAGAAENLVKSLAVADVQFGDSSGVVSMDPSGSLSVREGKITVTPDPHIDNFHNGLPDWWEQLHQLDLFSASAGTDDLDGDGNPNLTEFVLGSNPHVSDNAAYQGTMATNEAPEGTFLTLQTNRRNLLPPGMHAVFEESRDMLEWQAIDLSTQMVGFPVGIGDGIEKVTIRTSFPMVGPQSSPKGFLRLRILSD